MVGPWRKADQCKDGLPPLKVYEIATKSEGYALPRRTCWIDIPYSSILNGDP